MDWQPSKQSALTFHQQIIDYFTSRISTGDFPAGMKCPSQRMLAKKFNVNRSTINSAFEELKADGLLETRIGAGTYISTNPWPQFLAQPKWQQHIDASVHKPSMETIQMINEYEQKDEIIRLGTGELAIELLPTEMLQQSLQQLVLLSRAMGYSEPQGSLQLRQTLCSHLKKRGIETTPQNLLITSGALQAFQLIAQGLLERGSVVFQQKASYLNSINPFQSAGMQMASVNNDEQLYSTMQKMKRNRQGIYYAIPTLDNPTGRNWTMEEKEAVYNACKTLSIPIVEDDIYSDLLFDDVSTPMKAMDESGHILYVGSISKSMSPGLRVGWVVGPESVIKRLADIKMQTDYGSSALSQAVVNHWLISDLYEDHTKKLRLQLKERADFMEQLLEKHFKEFATWQSPSGGFYIWLQFSKPIITKQLFLELVAQKILINPGYIYEPNNFHYLRLSYAYASFEEMKKGIEIIATLVKKTVEST